MFRNFKSQIPWCIICTFITGILFGIFFTLIEYRDITFIFFIAPFLSLIFTIEFWRSIFKRLDLQDKINSIYTDID